MQPSEFASAIEQVLAAAAHPLKAMEIASLLGERGMQVGRKDVNQILYSGPHAARFAKQSGYRWALAGEGQWVDEALPLLPGLLEDAPGVAPAEPPSAPEDSETLTRDGGKSAGTTPLGDALYLMLEGNSHGLSVQEMCTRLISRGFIASETEIVHALKQNPFFFEELPNGSWVLSHLREEGNGDGGGDVRVAPSLVLSDSQQEPRRRRAVTTRRTRRETVSFSRTQTREPRDSGPPDGPSGPTTSRTITRRGRPVMIMINTMLSNGGSLAQPGVHAREVPLKRLPGGVRIAGRYVIEDVIGEGGMGVVYRAKDESLGTRVALKTVGSARGSHADALRNEVGLLVRLSKPDYFPRVYEEVEYHDQLFVPMEWIDSPTLRQVLDDTQVNLLDARMVVRIFDQVCDRLHYLHNFAEGQILFRDLKPDNILIDREDHQVYLIDFGIASIAGTSEVDGGTLGFWAPEGESESRYSVRSDVYALGKVLLCLIAGTGRVQGLEGLKAVPMAADRHLPEKLLEAVGVLCAVSPTQRPGTIRQAQDLVHAIFEDVAERQRDSESGPRNVDCPTCGSRQMGRFYLCDACGERLKTVPRSGELPDWPQVIRGCISTATARFKGESTISRRRFELIEQAASLQRIPAYENLLCLPHIAVHPYPYQIGAALTVLGRFGGRAILADEVGLGKTIEAGLVLKEYLVRREARRVLILVPPAMRFQWRSELREKFNINAFTLGNADEDNYSSNGVLDREELVLIMSYAKARLNPLFEKLQSQDWDMVIFDEAHHATPTSKTGALVMGLQTKRLLLLTATPAQNRLSELYQLVNLLKPGLLGANTASFEGAYGGKHREWTVRNEDLLRAHLSQVMVRNRRSEVHKAFPTRQASTEKVDLSPLHRKCYQEFVGHLQQAGTGLVLVTRAQQFCTSFESLAKGDLHPVLEEIVGRCLEEPHFKLAFFLEHLVPELADEPKVLVFSRFVESQREIYEALCDRGISALWATGTPAQRLQKVKQFRVNDDVQYLVSGASLSEGLNLQFCRCMVNFDLPWNPQQIEQRIGRIQRLGSKYREVFVFNLMAQGTIEELVIEYIEKKLNMFEEVFGFVEVILGQLREGESIEGFVRQSLRRGREGGFDPVEARKGAERLQEAHDKAASDASANPYDSLLVGLGSTFKVGGGD